MDQPHISKLVSQGLLTAAVGIVGAAVLATLPMPAFSATTGAAPNARAQYARDVAHCRSLKPQSTERANCLSEASTRFSMTQPSKPQEAPEILARNALRRCESLPPADKTECVARMQHGSVSGSVAGGGVLRQLVTREVVTDPAALPPTAAGAAASGVPAAPPITPAPTAPPVTVPAPPMPPQPSPVMPPSPAPVVPNTGPVPEPVPPAPTPVPPMQPSGGS
jgi:hypothetical protein